MFYISRQVNEYLYEVMDTSDGVAEVHTINEILGYVSNGIRIKGVDSNFIYPTTENPYEKYIGIKLDEYHSTICLSGTNVLSKTNNAQYFYTGYYLDSTGKVCRGNVSEKIISFDGIVANVVDNVGNFLCKGFTEIIGEIECVTTQEFLSQWGYTLECKLQEISKNIASTYVSDKVTYDQNVGLYRLNNYSQNYSMYGNIATGSLKKTTFSVGGDKHTLELIKAVNANGYINLLSNKQVPLKRIIARDGIYYQVLCKDADSHRFKVERFSIEHMIDNYKDFLNVDVTESTVKVRSLDGVFLYSIPILHTVYQKYGSKNSLKQNAKNKLLGVNGTVSVMENGDLNELQLSSDCVYIPTDVKCIKSGSLKFSTDNKQLIIGDNVKKCEVQAFDTDSTILGTFTINFRTSDYQLIKQVVTAFYRTYLNRIAQGGIDLHFVLNDQNFTSLYTILHLFDYYPFNRNGYCRDMDERVEYFDSQTSLEIIKNFRLKEINDLDFLREKAKPVPFAKLPFEKDKVSLEQYSSYSKWVDRFTIYGKLVTCLSRYLEPIYKYSIINDYNEAKGIFDKRKREFMQTIERSYRMGYKIDY